jgi:HlyD family secretion protein
VWESQDTIRVPLSALFRQQGDWAVFVEQQGRAVLRKVQTDHQNGSQVQITNGLDVGERVVLHPNERIADGSRIRTRVDQ